jgi:hypothetical protein
MDEKGGLVGILALDDLLEGWQKSWLKSTDS